MNQLAITFIGIDWADKKHDFHLVTPDGKTSSGIFQQSPKAIAQVVQQWKELAGQSKLAVAIEATKGALINALLEVDGIDIYPINPSAMASYRKAFAHGGTKNDIVDARLLTQYLMHYHGQLRPLRQDDPLTRELAALCEDRRGLVERRADLSNELTAVLKTYFPAILGLRAAKPYAVFLLALLLKYSTLEQIQKAGANKLRKFFHAQGLKANAEKRIESLLGALPLTSDETLLRVSARRATGLCEQLQVLNKLVKRIESELERLLPQHPCCAIAASFPHAATVTQARLITAMGDDRSRFPTSASLSTCSGIAPVTIQSGRMNVVRRRWACPKFMKQTFHEYAGQSLAGSGWAKAYYELQLSRGKSKQVAKRTLAFKWQRIMHRCWDTGQPYDEARYVERLRATGSPIIAVLDRNSATSA